MPPVAGLPPDLGRETGVDEVAADRFNCLGPFSDGNPQACTALASLAGRGAELTRAYKTPSLRGVAGRPPYMHAGQMPTLEAVLDHYSRAPASLAGYPRSSRSTSARTSARRLWRFSRRWTSDRVCLPARRR